MLPLGLAPLAGEHLWVLGLPQAGLWGALLLSFEKPRHSQV